MKGIIVIGGYGARMRPLTISMPKTMIPVGNIPMLEHHTRGLAKAGCTEIILAISHDPTPLMTDLLHKLQEELEIKISMSIQADQISSCGRLKNAEDLLAHNNESDCFLVFDCQVLVDFNELSELIRTH